MLSDHYDPGRRVLRLSEAVFDDRSLAALGVAAHEAGHALQYADAYWPMRARALIVRPASIGSNLGIVLAMLGLVFNSAGLLWLGAILFGAFVLFTLVTLPVEFDASNRALRGLSRVGNLSEQEVQQAGKVLRAAGLTYLAAAATALLQFLYFVLAAGDE